MSTSVRSGAIAAGVAGAMAIAGVAAAAVHAAPVPVQQFPANGIISNGITSFGTYSAFVKIDTAGPGAVWLTAPAGRQCGNPAVADSFVRFSYTNLSNGRAGSGTVRPCPGPWSGTQKAKLTPGAGVVVGTVTIISRGGPWALPGGATFSIR